MCNIKAIVIMLFICCSAYLHASENIANNLMTKDPMTYNKCNTINKLQQLIKSSDTKFTLIARSGCCSHHGGVCGCQGERQLCCDGTLSPSCGC